MRYRTIVADPPWAVERSFGGANWRNGERDRPALDYPTMSLRDIRWLPVRKLAEDNAHLYLWTTNQYLREAFGLPQYWGFSPASLLTWCKPRGGFVGGSFYPNTEYVIFARRGTLATKQRVNSSWFEWPRGEHSQKPEAFLDLVEETSPGPYLEMFARRNRLGWDTWGNEALEHVQIGDAVDA